MTPGPGRKLHRAPTPAEAAHAGKRAAPHRDAADGVVLAALHLGMPTIHRIRCGQITKRLTAAMVGEPIGMPPFTAYVALKLPKG